MNIISDTIDENGNRVVTASYTDAERAGMEAANDRFLEDRAAREAERKAKEAANEDK